MEPTVLRSLKRGPAGVRTDVQRSRRGGAGAPQGRVPGRRPVPSEVQGHWGRPGAATPGWGTVGVQAPPLHQERARHLRGSGDLRRGSNPVIRSDPASQDMSGHSWRVSGEVKPLNVRWKCRGNGGSAPRSAR